MSLKSENTSKIPELRFPEFHDEWTEKKLDNISKISSGGTPNRSIRPYWNGNIPWITTSLIDFNIIDKAEEYITEEGLSNSSAKLFPKETILMAMYGQGKTRGKVAILNLEASTNQACAAITLKKDVNTIFVFQYLIKKYERVRNTANDGGQKNLSAGLIKSIKISIPNLPEQQKIATFLTSIDERIQFLEKKKSRLEAYKKGVMQKLFSQQIRFKDDAGNDFPDWEEKRLGEIGEFKTSSVDKKIDDNLPLVNLVNYMNVYRHEIISNETKVNLMQVSATQTQLNSNDLKKGDILFTPSSETPSDIGHSVVIFEDLENTLYSYHLMRFRPAIEIALTYAHYFCNIPSVLKQISRFATGSTRFTISVESFSKVQVALPSLPEQKKIASFLTSIDKSIESIEKEIEGTTVFKKGLLQKMFV